MTEVFISFSTAGSEGMIGTFRGLCATGTSTSTVGAAAFSLGPSTPSLCLPMCLLAELEPAESSIY